MLEVMVVVVVVVVVRVEVVVVVVVVVVRGWPQAPAPASPPPQGHPTAIPTPHLIPPRAPTNQPTNHLMTGSGPLLHTRGEGPQVCLFPDNYTGRRWGGRGGGGGAPDGHGRGGGGRAERTGGRPDNGEFVLEILVAKDTNADPIIHPPIISFLNSNSSPMPGHTTTTTTCSLATSTEINASLQENPNKSTPRLSLNLKPLKLPSSFPWASPFPSPSSLACSGDTFISINTEWVQ
ncbi:hypothetical protein Pcinc_017255 [Petrolisthes cinctipes]|uniref:Uncharacterized protein n=1 Tax=Petrolisthes cinctipes TaxID=88211 RepID=A0AAE1FQM9_PETCI|nr:hypothetical protein Pcinc_017255 [Petrolisthes cinctipes]